MNERPAGVDEGIVLSWRSQGEADKSVVLFSLRQGKIHAVARGAMKPTSRSGREIEPFVLLTFLIRNAGALPLLTQIQTVRPFLALRSTPAAARRGIAVLEIMQRVLPEERAARDWWQVAYQALQRLDGLAARRESDVLLDAAVDRFKLEVLQIEGMEFDPGSCEECGRQDPGCRLTYRGEICCPECNPGTPGETVGHLQAVTNRLAGRSMERRPFSAGERELLRLVLHRCFSARLGVELQAEPALLSSSR